jgi:hypothetical protein
MMEDHLADIRRYDPTADAEAVERIIKYLGVALKNPRSIHIDPLEEKQAVRVREKWCARKLGCTDADKAGMAINMAALAMEADAEKRRVTFYYLVAKQLGQLERLN